MPAPCAPQRFALRRAHYRAVARRVSLTSPILEDRSASPRENESVALTPGEGKRIVDAPRLGPDRHGCFDQRGDAATAEELIVRAALTCDELREPARLEHPAEQLEEANEVRLTRAVCADQHRDLGKAVDPNVGERAKTADVDRLDGGHRGHRITGRCAPSGSRPVRETRLPRYSRAATSTARPSLQDSQTASVKRM